MSFNADKFERAKFEARRAKVPVVALSDFFEDGETPEWEVRGLSTVELHKAIEASKRQGSIEAIVKAIAANQDQAGAVRMALGLTKDTPGEIAKRLEMLVMGSVSPKIELPGAVKLAENFPIEFLGLTNEISELTGKGAELVKPPAASRKMTASESQ
ncbi:MAG: hypothetical protein ACEQSH_00745 [Bacteroidia bacterium]